MTLSFPPPRWLAAALFALALGAASWRAPAPAAPTFAEPPAATSSPLAAEFAAEMLPLAGMATGAASLVQLPDGRLAAAWAAGNATGAEELAIWFALFGKAGWSEPRPIASREDTAGSGFAHVSRIGRPLLYVEGSWLHLWYTSAIIGEHGALWHTTSTDAGQTWRGASRLPASPLGMLATAAGAPPVPLADGGLGLPVAQAFIARHGEWLRLAPDGRILDKVRMARQPPAATPAVAVLDARRALAVLPPGGAEPAPLRSASSSDGGQRWPAGAALPVNTPNSPVALLRLKSGRLLLAGNPASGRETLLLWLSSDQGQSWQQVRSVDSAPDGGADFSSPSLLQTRDGRIHLAYTWRRQGIKHAVFSEAWLDGERP